MILAMMLQTTMQAATSTMAPDTPLEHRHLILAYAAVFLIQIGYAAYVAVQRWRLKG